MDDIIERLEACLNAPEGSPTEDETEKAIREAIGEIKRLRQLLKEGQRAMTKKIPRKQKKSMTKEELRAHLGGGSPTRTLSRTIKGGTIE